jgi:hypothetical protein
MASACCSAAAVLVSAGGSKGAAAGAGGDLSQLEVAEEFFPFLIRGDPVFFARAQGPAAGEEGQVGLDGLVGVDRLVAHRGSDVLVACDDLGDVRWQAADDGVGDEDPAEVVRRVMQRLPVGRVFQAGVGKSGVEHVPE